MLNACEFSPRMPPTSRSDAACVAAGINDANAAALLESGIALRTSLGMTCCDWLAVWTSTTGASHETVIVSAIEPSFMSAFTVAVNPVGSSIPSRSNVEKP